MISLLDKYLSFAFIKKLGGIIIAFLAVFIVVDVIDNRLDQLSNLSKSKKKIYANMTFVDIAGLVKGASKGEGLGNKFLAHIREVDAIIHLVRCFDSEKITHVNSNISPTEDLETIKTEIILSDLDLIQKKLEKGKKKLLG